jgi:hypothetical protein
VDFLKRYIKIKNLNKVTNMNWFKQIVINWVREDWDSAGRAIQEDCYPTPKMSTLSRGNGVDSEPTLNFKVYSAVGGKIVEFSRYDPKTDKHDRQMYIIGRDEDFGEKIAKISTLEVLR